jgi:hypothetical protein
VERRTFIRVAAAGAGVVALPVGFFTVLTHRAAARGLIMRHLGYLSHDPDGIERFIDEYFGEGSDASRLRVRLLYATGRDIDDSWLVNDIVEQYLRGTDFFRTGMDESRTVTFGRLHSPYAGGCSNPFAMIYYPKA